MNFYLYPPYVILLIFFRSSPIPRVNSSLATQCFTLHFIRDAHYCNDRHMRLISYIVTLSDNMSSKKYITFCHLLMAALQEGSGGPVRTVNWVFPG